jgi:GT2 family glycosyltransferase
MVNLSICITTLNACDYLQNCLRSIYEQSEYLQSTDGYSNLDFPSPPLLSTPLNKLTFELIIVDNASDDGTVDMLHRDYPEIKLFLNEKNDGFAKPMNQAMRASLGDYFLILNPDTIILPGALNELVVYLVAHPDVGICGPKVLNRDGSLQKACRRGVSRPWAAFSYFSGLSALFPKSKFFGGYLLNYLDENSTHEVDGVSGSCMLVRRVVVEQVGYFDERFFAYQEDADFCFQAKKAGWKVVYHPQAQIIHYGGQGGSRVHPYHAIYEWHRSYFLYYQKNLAKDYFFIFNWFYYILMGLKLTVSLIANALRRDKFAGPRRG